MSDVYAQSFMTFAAAAQKARDLLSGPPVSIKDRKELLEQLRTYLTSDSEEPEIRLTAQQKSAWVKAFAFLYEAIPDRRVRLTRGQYAEIRRRAEEKRASLEVQEPVPEEPAVVVEEEEEPEPAVDAPAEAEVAEVVAEAPPVAEEVAVDEEGLISDNASAEDVPVVEEVAVVSAKSGEIATPEAGAGEAVVEEVAIDDSLASEEDAQVAATTGSEEIIETPAQTGVTPEEVIETPKETGLEEPGVEPDSDSGFSLSNLDSESLRLLEESDALIVIKGKGRQ
jgi:hypothetical protein